MYELRAHKKRGPIPEQTWVHLWFAATRAMKDNIAGNDQDKKSLTTRVNVYFVYFSNEILVEV